MRGETGVVVWEGASRLTGDPIAVILTWTSSNAGTGPMAQSWIIRTDAHPTEAIRDGRDAAICPESCSLRVRAERDPDGPQTRCYAAAGRIGIALSAMYARFREGGYPRMTPEQAGARLTMGKLRIGAYGDPAAVPISVWTALVAHTVGHTGYTHAPQRAPLLRALVMASCESPEQALVLQAQGWRTYRVRQIDSRGVPEAISPREMVCPKSQEAGQRLTCGTCLLCDGTGGRSSRSIAVVDHWAVSVTRRRRTGDLAPLVALRRSREEAAAIGA